MNKLIKFSIVISILLLSSCKEDDSEKYKLNKPVWDIEDYKSVTSDIIYNTPDGELLPTFSSNPALFNKIVDKNNISKVLDDENLGLDYREKYGEKLFDIWRNMHGEYLDTDRQDKFIYPIEIVKLKEWGYFIQIKYFKLGNDAIIKNAVDPDGASVQNLIKSNEQVAVDNFELTISFLTNESSLNDKACNEYSAFLINNYRNLSKTFPKANYNSLIKTIDNILKKINSTSLKEALNLIKEEINAKSIETNDLAS
ncbi:MAG: hypothetical protein BM557_11405 [Flavobacterium sp. MedPE-SWcel]|uniref:hypothetical protein n=1 Tax=uncultured Flavobacterium sp. TaxID=165435 RepID=UPI00091A55A5|nr:hypothetical protein [uncultured Flavobacterium sp.]OIQ15368.1 MAG: hypothetical protein BM557_11405 [Flavobacterium sp. MedPE-SWcel]